MMDPPEHMESRVVSTPKIALDVFEGVVLYLDRRGLRALACVCRFLKHVATKERAWRKENVPYVGQAYLPAFSATFPAPKGIQINMMPILANNLTGTLPEDCRGYRDMIQQCLLLKNNGVVYLTIDERRVPAGEAHRRSGLHVESPVVRSGDPLAGIKRKQAEKTATKKSRGRIMFNWGFGSVDSVTSLPVDGIYFGSNIAHSSRLYRHVVLNTALVGRDGDLGSVRHLFSGPMDLKAGAIFWMTDKTPHESLPLPGRGMVYRQFFRLVVGPIDVWFSKHNTLNPHGVLPDCQITDIDKFADIRTESKATSSTAT
ncbi:hypothetical protein M427DRAFT_51479 [Gonapodya prolifera JEL478]|uniref:F-box domain-containing protein n=1 Tax=Gonapodya prolifera (strain JEL478) TaxID=1344416 RepID=A0A139AWX4_GONPJ|nr:hypothetical protein M427DRAFT_51479 [Gonapodya prolifera JEL478]|eukprot:KXS21218.1 hypothetical protein M427DRAFT_51479 [Gonapodya prolifera JEL478]